MHKQIENPIIHGFNPDPSICRVGDCYYIACSSFSFFPGLPLYKSYDLANWEHIGYALTRPQQLRLTPDRLSYGIWAPTLRYHAGKFYTIVGNWSSGEVLIVSATDPEGDWSDAVYIDGIGGDPSLFFDDDGRVYCSYSARAADDTRGIYQNEIDVERGVVLSERKLPWNGAAREAHAPEASHVYKKDGMYYLLTAEGGTEHYHAVVVGRCETVDGYYKGFRGNPILSHRHLSENYPICNIGHADIVETPQGEWYMVALGSRLIGGYHKNMGRETFICPMVWESRWPRPAVDTGKVEWTYPLPAGHTAHAVPGQPVRDGFDGETLGLQWNFIGTPINMPIRLADGCLYIKAVAERIWKDNSEVPPVDRPLYRTQPGRALGFVGRRQQHMRFDAACALKMQFDSGNETAGLVILQNAYSQFRLELGRKDGANVLRLWRLKNIFPLRGDGGYPDLDINPEYSHECLAEIPWNGNSAVLKMSVREQMHSFYAGTDEYDLRLISADLDGSFLGSENSPGFIGAYVGMFASGNDKESAAEAAFDWFDYRELHD